MDLWENKQLEEKIARLRLKWLQAKKDKDDTKCLVIEKMVRALKISNGEK